jgi:NAD(P)-dependent dehydrogenase (short-subunit alcohol dehydrogenase family)
MSTREVAVVTGASRGIGRAVARRLAERWEIVALARSEPELESLRAEIVAAGGHCRPVPCDVTDAMAVERALTGVEADVLVNNAGIGIMKPLVELSVDEWRRTMSVNVDALFYVTRALLPGMLRRRTGHVVTIGSLAGRNPFAGGTCYSASKHAVVGFTESLMLEVRDAGVRVSTIMPGSVATSFFPPGRETGWMTTPEEIADAAWFLLSERGAGLVSRIEVRPAMPPKKG